MPKSSSAVGKTTTRFRHVAEARWLMAYAASLNDTAACYFDTMGEIAAHPVFSVCPEWPVVLAARKIDDIGAGVEAENRRGVHATHDVVIARPIAAGDVLFTQARIVGVEQRRPGAYQVMRMTTENAAGETLITTYQGGLTRDVPVVGGDRWEERPPALPDSALGAADGTRIAIPVAAGAAHTYTECARIWNPIHTDRAVAIEAGLPDILLHGTATLALAVSKLIDRFLDGDPLRVARYACRFSAMVFMPSTLTLIVDARTEDHVWFTVLNEQGEKAISGGYLGMRRA